MTVVADVVAQFRADTSDFQQKVDGASDSLDNLGSGSGDRLAGEFKKAGDGASNMASDVGAAGQVLGDMDSAVDSVIGKVKGLTLATLGIAGFSELVMSAARTTEELQTLGVQMNATFGPGGTGMLKQSIEYANQFGISVAAAGSAFVAFGQATKGSSLDLTKEMASIADIAAGTGSSVDALSSAIGNYYQIIQRSGGQGGAAGRYAQQLVTSHVITQEEANKLRIMANQGADPSALVGSILASGEQTYKGAAAAQADTLGNQIQVFKNKFQEGLGGSGGAMTPMFKDLTEGLKGLNQWMEGGTFKTLVKDFQDMIAVGSSAVQMLAPFGQEMLTITTGVIGLAKELGPIAPLISTIVAGFLAWKAVKVAEDFLYLGSNVRKATEAMTAQTTAVSADALVMKADAGATVVDAAAKVELAAASDAAAAETAAAIGSSGGGISSYGMYAGSEAASAVPGETAAAVPSAKLAPEPAPPGLLARATESPKFGAVAGIAGMVAGTAAQQVIPGPAGQVIGSTLQGAGVGAMVGGVPGAAVGAVAGLALGAFTSAVQSATKAVEDYTARATDAAAKQIEQIKGSVNPNASNYDKIQQGYQESQQNFSAVSKSMPKGSWDQPILPWEHNTAGEKAHQDFLQAQKVKQAFGSEEAAANNNITEIEALNPSFGKAGSPEANTKASDFAAANNIDITKPFADMGQAIQDATAKLITLGNGAQYTAEQLSNKLGFQATQIAGQQGQKYVNLGAERKTDPTTGQPIATDTGAIGHMSWDEFSSLAQKTGTDLSSYGAGGITEAQYNSPQMTSQYASLLNSNIASEQALQDATLAQTMAVISNTTAVMTQKSATSSAQTAITSGYTPQYANFQSSMVGNTSLTQAEKAAMTAVIDQYTALESSMNRVDSATQNYARTVEYDGETFIADIKAGESLATEFTKLSDKVSLVQAEMSAYQDTLSQTLQGTKAYNQEKQNETLASARTSKAMAELQLSGVSTSSPQYRNLERQAAIQQQQSTITQSNYTTGLGNQQFQISQAQIGQEVGYDVMIAAGKAMGDLKTQLYNANQDLAKLNPAYTAQNNLLKEAAPAAQAVATAASASTQADIGLQTSQQGLKDSTNALTEATNTWEANFSVKVSQAMSDMTASVQTLGLVGGTSSKVTAMIAQEWDMMAKSLADSSKGDTQGADALASTIPKIADAGNSVSADQIKQWVGQFNAQNPDTWNQYQTTINAWNKANTPAKAEGGPTLANTPYLIGEKGPEIMVPGAGTIIPNAALAANPTSFSASNSNLTNSSMTNNISNLSRSPSITSTEHAGSITISQGAVQVAIDVYGGVGGTSSNELTQEITSTVNDALLQIVQKWNGK